MRYCYLAILVAALLFVRHLVFDLQRTSASFDHLLCKQICCFCVAEPCVDVGDDRHDMRLMAFNLVHDGSSTRRIVLFACIIQLPEQYVQLAAVGLTQKGVEFFDKGRNTCFLMHGLVGQWAKFAAQRSNHPA